MSSCPHCGRAVTEVPDRTGTLVPLDGRDPAGEWWAAKAGERWLVVKPMAGEDPPSGGWRYAEHRCALLLFGGRFEVTRVPDVPAVVTQPGQVSLAGDCAGHCGGMSPRRYGPDASPLCDSCREVLERWRATPASRRGQLRYGRWVKGVYVRASEGGNHPQLVP